MKKGKDKIWTSPTKKFIQDINQHIQENGISKEDKDFLMDELDDMIEMLQNWKDENQPIPHKKAS
jgi:gas vesicle protein